MQAFEERNASFKKELVLCRTILMSIPSMTLLILGLCTIPISTSAEVHLPNIIGNNMVLQREIEVPIWGWAIPGKEITVEFAHSKTRAEADAQGRWMIKLPAMKAGGPYRMTVTGTNEISLTNIYVGEVWLCSGQSNMQMGLKKGLPERYRGEAFLDKSTGLFKLAEPQVLKPRAWHAGVLNYEKEIAEAHYPEIRLFQVPPQSAGQPVSDVDATWQVCQPNSVQGFSAVAYFFGRELHKEPFVIG